MSADESINAVFRKYRGYLTLAAAVGVDARLRDKFDASDVVQETLLEAARDWESYRGRTEEERLGWLRRIFAHNLLDGVRRFRADKRDAGRERSLEEEPCKRRSDGSAKCSPPSKPPQHARVARRARPAHRRCARGPAGSPARGGDPVGGAPRDRRGREKVVLRTSNSRTPTSAKARRRFTADPLRADCH